MLSKVHWMPTQGKKLIARFTELVGKHAVTLEALHNPPRGRRGWLDTIHSSTCSAWGPVGFGCGTTSWRLSSREVGSNVG